MIIQVLILCVYVILEDSKKYSPYTLADYKLAVNHPDTIKILIQWEIHPSGDLTKQFENALIKIKLKRPY